MGKKLLSIVLSLIIALSGVYIGSPSSFAAGEGTDRDLKVLKVAWRGDPSTLCHVTSPIGSFNTATHELMMDRLFEYDYSSGQLTPMLATGWEQLSDRTFRVTLRNDVYSWNGDKFKASDVLYTIQSAIDSGVQARYYGIFDTDNFVVEDDTHIVIALRTPDPFIQYALSNIPYGMLCEASVTAAGGLDSISGSEAELPNCYTGPYKPVEWELGSHIKFVKNANYWGEEPFYDEIIVYSIGDAYARAQALTNGTVDLALMPPEDLASNIENNSELDVYAYPTNQQVTLFMNTQSAPFDDVNLRISCALALNYENNIQVALGGYAEHSDDILAKKNIQYTSPSAEGYESYFHYDQEEVAEYMQDSPYYGTNPTVEIYYTPEFAAYAALVQQQWSAIGINVVLTEKAQTEYFSIMSSGEYQAYIVKNSNPDPYEQLKFYDGEHFDYMALNGGPQWNGGEEVTALYDSITSAYSLQAAAPYFKQLRRIINDNVPSVPLYTPYTLMYGKKGLTGLGLTLMGDPYITKVRGTEQSAPAALPAVVDVYTTSVENSMGSMTDIIQVDYWREKYPDTTFNLIYGDPSKPENIDLFASLGKTDGSAVLISNPGLMITKYQGSITNDLSDRSVFKAVSSSINSIQPQSLVLICRSDETRFGNIEELVDYIDSHPGEISFGYVEDSQFEIFIKNLLTVLDVSPNNVRTTSASIAELRAGVKSGTIDIIPLSNTPAEADISSGEVKGILHDVVSREGYPYNKEFLQNIPILPEVSVIDPSDYDKLLMELPNTVYVSAGTPSELCDLFNHATDGILENDSFAQRISALGSVITYQYYTLEQIDALQQRVSGQVQRTVAYESAPAAYLSFGTGQYTRNDDDVVYDFILGDYEQLLTEAKSKKDTDEKYAAFAKAEAELLGSGVILPTTTNSGKATTFLATLNIDRGTFVLDNGNAASGKTESEKISSAVALSNRNFRQALNSAFDRASYNAVTAGEESKYDLLRNIFTPPELVSLSKQIEADGHVFAAGTTYGEMVQYYLTAAGSHINAADGQDGWYDPAAAVSALNAAKAELGSAVAYPIVIDFIYNSENSFGEPRALAYKQSVEQTLGSENVRVDLIPVNYDDYMSCGYFISEGSEANFDAACYMGWAADNNVPSDFLNCYARKGDLIGSLGITPHESGPVPADLPEVVITSSDADNEYNYYECVHVTAYLRNQDGTTAGIADQYPGAWIRLTVLDEYGGEVGGFITQQAVETGNSFPLCDEYMEAGNYKIMAEATLDGFTVFSTYDFSYSGYAPYYLDLSGHTLQASASAASLAYGDRFTVSAIVTDANGAPAGDIKVCYQLQHLSDGTWSDAYHNGYGYIYDFTDQNGYSALTVSFRQYNDPDGMYRYLVWIEGPDGTRFDSDEVGFEIESADHGLYAYADGETWISLPPGSVTTFSVTAGVNDGDVHYQWYKWEYIPTRDGGGDYWDYVPIEGAQSSIYTTPELYEQGQWKCVVTNDFDNEVPVWFDVYIDNSFEFQRFVNGKQLGPDDYDYAHDLVNANYGEITVDQGDTVTLSVSASVANGGLTYKWYSGSVSDKNVYIDWYVADGQSYTLSDVQRTTYMFCVITDEFGNEYHIRFFVEIDNGFTVNRYERDSEVYEWYGTDAILKAEASADEGELTYQWYNDDPQILTGETGSELNVGPTSDNEQYDCVITDMYGSVRVARMMVHRMAPAEELELNTPKDASVDVYTNYIPESYDKRRWFSFTPSQTGMYSFSVNVPAGREIDNSIILLNGDLFRLKNDKYWSNDLSEPFSVNNPYWMNAGEKYYFGVAFRGPLNSDPIEATLLVTESSMSGIVDGVKPLNDEADVYAEYGDDAVMTVDLVTVYSSVCTLRWYKLDDEGNRVLIHTMERINDFDYSYAVRATESRDIICEVTDDYGCTKEIVFHVHVKNGLTIAPKDGAETVYVESGKDIRAAVEAKADRGSITYTWYDATDGEPVKLYKGTADFYSLTNVVARRLLLIEAEDMFGEAAVTQIEILPVTVEVDAGAGDITAEVSTQGTDNNIAGSTVPDEALSGAVENGQNVVVSIVVSSEEETPVPESDKESIIAELADTFPDESAEDIQFVTIGINYTVGDEDPQPVTETKEPIQIRFEVEGAVEGGKYVVIRMHTDEYGNSKAEIIPSTYEYVESEGKGYVTVVSDKFSSFAVQRVNSSYTIFFNFGDPDTAIKKEAGLGGIFPSVDDPEMEGFSFKGWTLNGEEFVIGPDTRVTEDLDTDNDNILVLTAVWEKNKYNVRFYDDDGTLLETQTVEYMGKASRPENIAKEGWNFEFWYGQDGREFSFNTLIKEDVEVYAAWSRCQYTVSFNTNGAGYIDPVWVSHGNTVERPEDPVRNRLIFNGWTLNGELYDFNSPVLGNITLVADWKPLFIKAYGGSLSLEGDIGINFKVVIPDEVFVDEEAYITLDENVLPIKDATKTFENGIEMYEFKYSVPAKEMNREVTLRAYSGNGEPIRILRYSNGNDITETGYKYSVQKYIRAVIKNSSSFKPSLVALVKAMSDYGSKAQHQFNYQVESAAELNNSAGITAVTVSDLAPYKRVITKTDRNGIKYSSVNLTLESETIARLFFSVNTGTIDDYSFKLNGMPVVPYLAPDGYAIEIPNIAAKELDTKYKVEVYDAQGLCLTVDYCALSYAYLVVNNAASQPPALVELVKALYLYNQAANTYFGGL